MSIYLFAYVLRTPVLDTELKMLASFISFVLLKNVFAIPDNVNTAFLQHLPNSVYCKRPRQYPVLFSAHKTFFNVTEKECKHLFYGWDDTHRLHNSEMFEDAVLVNRFFRYGPLKHLRHGGGTFIELGAMSGYEISNTYLYEHCWGWNGVLIEAQPDNYKKLVQNRPCAYNVGEGVCNKVGSIRMSIEGTSTAYDLSASWNKKINVSSIEVPCRPLAKMLEEVSLTHVTLFSLDVEGAELKVLETIDWSKLQVDVLLIEMDAARKAVHPNQLEEFGGYLANKRDAIHSLLTSKTNLKKVPSKIECKPNAIRDPCVRSKYKFREHFLKITGSDIYVSPRLYRYDTTAHLPHWDH